MRDKIIPLLNCIDERLKAEGYRLPRKLYIGCYRRSTARTDGRCMHLSIGYYDWDRELYHKTGQVKKWVVIKSKRKIVYSYLHEVVHTQGYLYHDKLFYNCMAKILKVVGFKVKDSKQWNEYERGKKYLAVAMERLEK